MKVLFVASGNRIGKKVNSFVLTQYESLVNEGIQMDIFPIVGKGIFGYLSNILKLRKKIKEFSPDIIHAHYSVCGYLVSIATLFINVKIVVSILGSFPNDRIIKLKLVKFCINNLWDKTIVKSERTLKQLGLNLPIIPNGVNLKQFNLIPNEEARKRLNFKKNLKYVIWVSNPIRKEKNWDLAEKSILALNDNNIVLLPIFDKKPNEVVVYMCAADILLMTSKNEGSPNVIKEAMTCNCPIVTTNVGDVNWVLEDVDGTYIADEMTEEAIIEKIKLALDFNKRTEGRNKIISLGLTTEQVARKIINLYNTL